MPTFQAMVEDYTGTVSDTAALTDWLTSGAKYILNALPAQTLEKYAGEVAVTNGTTSLAEYVILGVIREGVPASRITPAMIHKISNAGSLFYATALTPMYALVNGVVNMRPVTGTGATATAVMKLASTLTIKDAGADYLVGESFTTLGGTNSGTASPHCTITITEVNPAGAITGIEITNAGVYTVLPTVSDILTGGGNLTYNGADGWGATFYASWTVVSVSVGSGGTGYSSTFPPFVVFSSGVATATAIVSTPGVVTGIVVTAGGDYLVVPSVTISGIKAYAIPYPTVAYNDSAVNGFPPQLYQGLVLYAAIKVYLAKATEALSVSFAISSFTIPSAPTFDSTTYSDALSQLDIALDTDEDIELAEGQINRGRLALEKYQNDLAGYKEQVGAQAAKIATLVQKSAQEAQAYLAMVPVLKAELNELIRSAS